MNTTTHYIQAAENHLAEAENANRAGMHQDMEDHLALAEAYVGIGHLAAEVQDQQAADQDALSFEELMGEGHA